MKRIAALILVLVMAVSSVGYVFAGSSEADSKVAAELKTVLAECVSDGAPIEAIGYERHPKKEGEDMTGSRFFSVIKDKEYVGRIVGLLKSASVFGIESDKPSRSNKYYTETLKIKYTDGKVCEFGIDGSKLIINSKEYKVYGLDSLRNVVHEATYKTRPALETFGEVLGLDLYGRLYTVDGEYYFDGKPDESINALLTEKDLKITDADVASYIVWMMNNAALPFDGVEDKASGGGTLLMLKTDGGYVLEIGFHKNGRVVLYTGKHPSTVYGSYMLPYNTAIEIFNIILDASDGQLESVEDVEAATDALIDEFYEKCERIVEEADDDVEGAEKAEDEDKLVGILEDDVYTVRYINLRHSADGTKSRKIYDIEGVSNCEKILNELKKVGFTPSNLGIAFGDGASVDYTKILLTDINGYTTELLIYPTPELLWTAKKNYTFDKNRLWSFERFIDGFENKTVIDPYADDMKGTALADGIAALLSNPSYIQSFSFTAEIRGGVARSKTDVPYNFSYMTSDPAYINEAVKLLAGCEFSKKPETHEKVRYTDVTVKFNTKYGVFELHAYSNGTVSYNGTYYGYLSDMCKDVYKLRSREAGKGIIMKSGTAGSAELDLFAKDVVKLTYKGVDSEAVTIDNEEKIEKIGVYVRNYFELSNAQEAGSADTESSVLIVEYADGTSGKVFFTRFDDKVLVQDGATARNYFIEARSYFTNDYEIDIFEQFFEFYKMSDGIKISDWAKPELEKAVLYGFTGIDDLSDDHKRAITRGETCDILMWPVKDIMGIWFVTFYAPPYQDSMSYEGIWILTGIGAVDGKETVEKDGFTFRYFKQDDLLTREELSKIVVGIYTSEEYRELLGDTSEFKLPDVAKTSFADDSEISDWAKPYVEFTRELGIFKGDDKGNFNPKGNCTKEEVVAVAVRLYEMMLKNIED